MKKKKNSTLSTITEFDSAGLSAGDWITVSGTNSSDGVYTINNTSAHTITVNDAISVITEERFRDLEDSVEAIKRRLAILDEPSPETLEKHKILKDAYNKYKMIEALIGEKDG